jgi:hypothetical protein
MKHKAAIPLLLFSLALPAAAQGPPPQAPVAQNPVVEIQGKIAAVKLMPGQGMPAIDLDVGSRVLTVWLGSMRYLMEQKFSPNVGEMVLVKGYSVKNEEQEEEIVAISVKLLATNQVVTLRDENGFPLWRGAGWRYGSGPDTARPRVGSGPRRCFQ